MERKVLYSVGVIAWSTDMDSVPTRFACEYQPLIDWVEANPDHDSIENSPAFMQFIKDVAGKFNIKIEGWYYCSARLAVATVPDGDMYQVIQSDRYGYEEVLLKSKQEWL